MVRIWDGITVKFLIGLFLLTGFLGANDSAWAKSPKHSPYLMIASLDGATSDYAAKVKDALIAGNFEVIGEYNPEGKQELHVIAYTRGDLQDTTLQVENRGFLASVLKVALVKNGDKVDISMVNPEYLFRGYLLKEYAKHSDALSKIATDAKAALGSVGSDFTPFGGALTEKTLEHYHYKIMMPYFNDPVFLRKYKSFEEGVETIRKNLAAQVGGTREIFAIIRSDSKTALFGVELGDKETGEQFFLPKIGEHNVAALPYEILLQGNQASMLHGKFRIAIHWPTLSMVFGKFSFAQIMSTPGAIEDTMWKVTGRNVQSSDDSD